MSVHVKVTKIGDTRVVGNKKWRKQDVWIADKTGYVSLCLWEDNVDRLEQDKTYWLRNIGISTFRGQNQFAIPRDGAELILDEEDLGAVSITKGQHAAKDRENL